MGEDHELSFVAVQRETHRSYPGGNLIHISLEYFNMNRTMYRPHKTMLSAYMISLELRERGILGRGFR